MMKQLIIGYVDSYSETDGHYHVRIPGFGMYSPPIDAYTISPSPGGGLKGAPKIAKDTEVLLAQVDDDYYIVGFPQKRGGIAHDSHFPVRPIGAGETLIGDSLGRKFGFNSAGSFFVYLTDFANFVLNPVMKKLTMTVANLRLNLWAGSVEYDYDLEKKSSLFKFLVKKKLDEGLPGVPENDRFQVFIGKQADNTHIVDGNIKQEFNSAKIPAFKTLFKIGKQTSGTWLDIATQIGAVAPSAVYYSVKADADGLLDITAKKGTTPDSQSAIKVNADGTTEIKVTKGTDKEISFKMDASSGIQIFVNKDKAQILVDSEGNIAFIQDPAAKLYLGGKDKGQQLVTKSFVEQIYLNHIHGTAAPGAPTTPPLMPPIIAIPMDSATSPYTYTTLAE